MTDYVSRYTVVFNDLASRGFMRTVRSASALASGLGKVTAGVGLMTGAALAAASATNAVTAEQARLSQSVGVSNSQLSALASVGKKMGFEFDNMVDLAEELNNKMGEMKTLGEMTSFEEGLKGINLQYRDLKKLSPDAQFEKILSAAVRMKDVQKSASSLDMIFGGEGSKIAGLLNTELKRLGLTYSEFIQQHRALNNLTDEGIAGAVAYTDSMAGLGAFMGSMGKEVFGLLGGVLSPFIDRLKEFLVANKEIIATKLGDFMENLGETLKNLDFTAIGDGIGKVYDKIKEFGGYGLKFVESVGGMETVVKGFLGVLVVGKIAGFVAALATLTGGFSPVGLAIAAVVAGGVLLYKNWDTVKAYAETLRLKLKSVWDWISTNLNWIPVIQYANYLIDNWAEIKSEASVLKDHLKMAWEDISSGLGIMFKAITDACKTAWDYLESRFNSGADYIASKINTIRRLYNSLATSGVGQFVGLPQAQMIPMSTEDGHAKSSSDAARAAVGQRGDWRDSAGEIAITIDSPNAKTTVTGNTSGAKVKSGSNSPVGHVSMRY